ncbi:MAG TPA: hypothetical protein VLA12_24150 [Planctomycetaceae bacterium]|nr:hypothetical protein [Planctomycetaceae bacterium]
MKSDMEQRRRDSMLACVPLSCNIEVLDPDGRVVGHVVPGTIWANSEGEIYATLKFEDGPEVEARLA